MSDRVAARDQWLAAARDLAQMARDLANEYEAQGVHWGSGV